MAANFDPKSRTVGEVLANTQLAVPDWQRPFAWTLPHIESFWNDITSFSQVYPDANINDKQYFLGSVVFVAGTPLEVLDGQQRLATSMILLSVIRDFLRTADSKASMTIQTTFIASYNIAEKSERDNLLMNSFDREFFSELIVRDAIRNPRPEVRTASHQDIAAARDFFVKAFEAKRTELGLDAFADWCRRVQKTLCEHCSVVQILTENEDTAASIFETLNDRGLSLSTVDLLRNFLLRNAPANDRDGITSAWEDILEDAIDFDISQFLRHYWTSKHGDVKSQGLYKEIKSQLQADGTNSLEFSLHIQEAAEDYANLVNGRGSNAELTELYKNINLLDATVLYPALLSANAVFTDEDPLRTLELGQTLLVAFVRHNVVAGREASQFESKAYEIARKLRETRDFDFRAELRTLMPNAAEFEAAFKNLSPRRMGWARYLLATIEQAARGTDETLLGPSATLHVEHIYPRKPRFEKWVDHDAWVNRLGNLTLLGRRLNTQASNGAFQEKKARYDSSTILMTKDLAKLDRWTAEEIERRQGELFTHAPGLWPEI